MMFQNGFCLAVKDSKGNILRESNGQVYLPFHSEYSLLLKNTKSMRAAVKVRIDGMDALGGDEIIVPAYGSTVLERFMLDGNLSTGKRFKFVPATDSGVQDPTSGDNGLVEAMFQEEYVYPQPVHWEGPTILRNKSFTLNNSGTAPGVGSFYCSSVGGMLNDSKMSFAPDSCSIGNAIPLACSAGATVEGAQSGQAFCRVANFDHNNLVCATRLCLRLMGNQVALTVKDTKHIHCSFCGKKNAFSANFCQGCGMKIARIS